MTVIPAIDIMNGRCVRLTTGDYTQQTIYPEDPLQQAILFEEAGLTRLHLVDLEGARAGKVCNWQVLEQITSQTKLRVDFSGGINSEDELARVFDSGAAYAAIGSMAVKSPDTVENWIAKYGAERFIIGADVKQQEVMVRGWTEATGMDVLSLIASYRDKGVDHFFCTDISKDGLLQGPGISLYKTILEHHPAINLVASGGITSLADIQALKKIGCNGAIIGKAIYENRISLAELSSIR